MLLLHSQLQETAINRLRNYQHFNCDVIFSSNIDQGMGVSTGFLSLLLLLLSAEICNPIYTIYHCRINRFRGFTGLWRSDVSTISSMIHMDSCIQNLICPCSVMSDTFEGHIAALSQMQCEFKGSPRSYFTIIIIIRSGFIIF